MLTPKGILSNQETLGDSASVLHATAVIEHYKEGKYRMACLEVQVCRFAKHWSHQRAAVLGSPCVRHTLHRQDNCCCKNVVFSDTSLVCYVRLAICHSMENVSCAS